MFPPALLTGFPESRFQQRAHPTGSEGGYMALQEMVPPAKAAAVIPAALPARTDRDGKAVSNAVLLSVPDEEFMLLRPFLEPVPLPRYQILYEQSGRIDFGYFLNEGMTSLVVITSDGRSVEVGIVGREGVVGTPLAVGLHRGPCRAIMQIPGSGVRVKAGVLEDTLLAAPTLQTALARYALMQGLQV